MFSLVGLVSCCKGFILPVYREHSEFCEQKSYFHSCLHNSLNFNFMKCSIMKFKGTLHRDFTSVFSYQKYSPRPLIRTLHFFEHTFKFAEIFKFTAHSHVMRMCENIFLLKGTVPRNGRLVKYQSICHEKG
jgi:hypothetical protein